MGLKYYNDLIWGLQAKLAKWFNFLEKTLVSSGEYHHTEQRGLIFGWFGVPPFEEVPPYQYCNLQQRTCIQNWTRKRPPNGSTWIFSLLEWSGWWLTYPSEKYERQLGWWHSQYIQKIKNVPNHQPVIVQVAFFGLLHWLSSHNLFRLRNLRSKVDLALSENRAFPNWKVDHHLPHQNCYLAYLGGILSDFQTYPLSFGQKSAHTPPRCPFPSTKTTAEVRIAMTERKQSDYNSPSSGEAKNLI